MKLSQCAAFVAVVDTGSFTGAARALGISQSAVSHAIAGLEAELGVGLMHRDRKGIELTDSGHRVLTHARAVMLHSEQMRNVAGSAAREPSGRIRIGTSQSFACRLLPALMTEFRGRYPELEIELKEGPDLRISEWLRGYAVDVGIVTLPKRDLKTHPLLEDQLYAVLPARHRLRSAAGVRILQLADEPLLMPHGDTEGLVRSLFRAVGLEPNVSYRVQNLNTLLAMVAEGHGVTVLPSLAMLPMSPALRAVPLAPAVRRKLAIGISPLVRNFQAVSAFVSTARALAGNRDWTLPPGTVGVGPQNTARPMGVVRVP
ncbi:MULTISPECIES: LysR family transcriptional regulator [unclassified Kitasatospora]|uniref:LysR family transcriptional regulator n=1 Tax=unclassified Kitasatospora TaxID=2633591 RepID=UPI0037F1A1A7